MAKRRLAFQKDGQPGRLDLFLNYSGGASSNSILWQGYILQTKDEQSRFHYTPFQQYKMQTSRHHPESEPKPINQETYHYVDYALASLENAAETAAAEFAQRLKLTIPVLKRASKPDYAQSSPSCKQGYEEWLKGQADDRVRYGSA